MPSVSRREFMEWAGATGAALALVESMPKSIALALEGAVKEFPLLWLQFSNCSGCSARPPCMSWTGWT